MPGNSTFNPDLCTLSTCPLSEANFTYVPSLVGNVLFLSIFAVLLIIQLFLGIRYRTWGFLVGMVCGLALEIMGYVGRVQLHYNPFPFNPFLEYLVCLTIAPAFLSASIYLCLGRIVVVYGAATSRLKPRTYSLLFVSSDFVSLVLQAAGGAITATAPTGDKATTDMGVNIMIAGLGMQVVSLAVFMALCVDLWNRIRRSPERVECGDGELVSLRMRMSWKAFLIAIATATIAIFIRSIFRVAELSGGFSGALANNQIAFMVLEGAMLVIACTSLTALHPGLCFAGNWDRGNWSFRARKIPEGDQGEGLVLKPARQRYSSEYRSGWEQEE